MTPSTPFNDYHGLEIAVIGMAGRFPGANNIDAFWHNLRQGLESISHFSDQELVAAGIDPALLQNPQYVKAGAVLDDIDLFDAAFFGYSPREAALMDPQQRIFLECAWEALEHAGYLADTTTTAIGVFAGVSMSDYFLTHLLPNQELLSTVGRHQTLLGNDKDYLVSRVSYKLNLEGPSVVVQAACASSLVAVHLAGQSLLSGECRIALAGGTTIHVPQKSGYLYQDGGINSPDGHCRAFDAQGQGTVSGNGVGIVVLKRLEDALADGDYIHAVIKGSAINNDGSAKLSYTAPRGDGQAKVIRAAQLAAEVDAETLSYIEAHGGATQFGDAIEVAALTRAFQNSTSRTGFCAIGSVKSNIGHLDAAAGIAALIKTILALKHQQIPPSLNFEQPNPQIDFAGSPFYVNRTLSAWDAPAPRRAGINSFGIGGTNAHIVLEEAPPRSASSRSRPTQLLLLSTKTPASLDAATQHLATFLKQHPEHELADVAYTLKTGRRSMPCRRAVVCRSSEDAIALLDGRDPIRVLTTNQAADERGVAFLFPGASDHRVTLAREIYGTEPTFRTLIDRGAALLNPDLRLNLRTLLYPTAPERDLRHHADDHHPHVDIQSQIAQPLLFLIEYALAQLWMEWGVQPQAMIGYGPGEYVAACLAGVLTFEDALRLLVQRAQLVPAQLDAASSRQAFAACVAGIELAPPRLPYISTVTGTWITADQATDPAYWTRHLLAPVPFGLALDALLQTSKWILLEVGPGHTLADLALQHPRSRHGDEPAVFASLPTAPDGHSDLDFLITTVGRLWLLGVPLDWTKFYAHEQRHRVPLPTYPFERRRYWVDLPKSSADSPAPAITAAAQQSLDQQFYLPGWKQSVPLAAVDPAELAEHTQSWLLFADSCGLADHLITRLEAAGHAVAVVRPGAYTAQLDARTYSIDPHQPQAYRTLLERVMTPGATPRNIIHLWSVTADDPSTDREAQFARAQDRGLYSLLYLAQALGSSAQADRLTITVVSNNMQPIDDEDRLCSEKATLLGPCRVIPQEYPTLRCRSIDVRLPEHGSRQFAQLGDRILAECIRPTADSVVAYRGLRRWVQTCEPIVITGASKPTARLRHGGVYLITGGFDGVGLDLARQLARSAHAKIILLGDADLPPRAHWDRWIAEHEPQHYVSQTIQGVRMCEDLGAEVLAVTANLADQEHIQTVLAEIYTRFGALHGVIHAAGMRQTLPDHPVQATTRADCDLHFQAHVYGVIMLETLLRDRQLDFCVLLSSMAAILGGPGSVAHAAASLFMDQFTHAHNQTHSVPWLSVNCDSWQLMSDVDASGQVFEQILALHTVPQLIVAAGDLQTRHDQAVRLRAWDDEQLPDVALASLFHDRPQLQNPYVAPRNELEHTLVTIWQKLLGINPIGIHDNYFALGGDSLLSIQIVSQVRQTGLQLTSRVMLDHPTIAELAAAVQSNPAMPASPGRVSADVPLNTDGPGSDQSRGLVQDLPAAPQQDVNVGAVPCTQVWFFEQGFPKLHHWNVAALLKVERRLELALMEQAVQYILAHHDALRLRFTPTFSGWSARIVPPDGALPLTYIDLSATPAEHQHAAIEAAAAELQASLNIFTGPMLRIGLFDLGIGQPMRLLLACHHVASDGFSLRVIGLDLLTVYKQLEQGSSIQLLPGTSFKQWAERVTAYAQSDAVKHELAYWRDQPWHTTGPVPVDDPNWKTKNTEGSRASVWASLSVAETQQLLQLVSDRYQGKMVHVLIAGLAHVFAEWTQDQPIVLEVVVHGRDALDDLDLSRTVGWVASGTRLILDAHEEDHPAATLQRFNERFSAMPPSYSYTLLRYLCQDPEVAQVMRSLPRAEVLFNYLGRISVDPSIVGGITIADESTGPAFDADCIRHFLLDIAVQITEDQLHIHWIYSKHVHAHALMEDLAEAFATHLRRLIDS